jgi:hypothetical protein
LLAACKAVHVIGDNDLQIGFKVWIDWRLSGTTSLFLGWCDFSTDNSDTLGIGAFEYDVNQLGPMVGVNFSFSA